MNLLDFKYEQKSRFLYLFFITVVIICGNITTVSSPINLIITIPQLLIVLINLGKNLQNAVLFHFLFCLLSLSLQTASGIFEDADIAMYDYGSLRIIGPLRLSYFISIIIALVFLGRNTKINRDTLLYKLFKYIVILGLFGIVIGLLGLTFDPNYSFQGFIGPAVYIFVTLINLFILVCNQSVKMYRSAYYLTLVSIFSGLVGSVFCYLFLGIKFYYSVFEVAYVADIADFAPLLIIGMIDIKEKSLLYLSLICYGYLSFQVIGGKTFFAISFALAALFYLIFFAKTSSVKYNRQKSIYKPFIVFAIILIPTLITLLSSDSMTYYKLLSFQSVFSGDINNMASSPYIRMASFLNIIREGLSNPLTLIFGNGYGGYFTDKLGLFSHMILSNDAWNDKDIAAGTFHSGHDMIVSVPLFNGLLGLFLLVKISFMYLKRLKINYMSAMVFLWILLKFYFNTNHAVMGVFVLFASEYIFNKRKIEGDENIIY